MSRRPRFALAAVAAGDLVLSGCAGGGSSDVVDGVDAASTAGGPAGTVNLFAYAVPKPGFDTVIPAFTRTEAGRGAQVQQSCGASGDQSRKMAAGLAPTW